MQEYVGSEIFHDKIKSRKKQSLPMKLKEIDKKLKDIDSNIWFRQKTL